MLCFNSAVGFSLSAPVLRWLFTAQGKPEGVLCPAILAMPVFHFFMTEASCQTGSVHEKVEHGCAPKAGDGRVSVAELFSTFSWTEASCQTGSVHEKVEHGLCPESWYGRVSVAEAVFHFFMDQSLLPDRFGP